MSKRSYVTVVLSYLAGRNIRVYMYTCIPVLMYTCIHVYMYFCIYVYMYTIVSTLAR